MSNNISNETLKKYAEIASEAFMSDPAYIHATKNEKCICFEKLLQKRKRCNNHKK